MSAWEEAKVEAGCNCPKSDAWRCVLHTGGHGVACVCRCHQYVRRFMRAIESEDKNG